MAHENANFAYSYPASGDLSAAQFLAVALDTSGNLVVEDGDAIPIGILQNKPAAVGRAGSVVEVGICKAIVSGTIVRGGPLAPSGNGTVSGYLVPTTTDNDQIIAHARSAHTADSSTQMGTVFVSQSGRY